MDNQFNKENLKNWQNSFFKLMDDNGKSPNTIKNYKTDLQCFNNYLMHKQGHLDISGFEISHIKDYGAYLDNKYNSHNSRRRRVQALRLFFDYLVERGAFNSNPVRKLPTSPKFLDIPRPTPFIDVKTLWVHLLEEEKNESDMAKLLALRNQVIMLLIYGAGLKVSDLQSITTAQVFKGTSPRVLIHHPKRDSYTIPLPPITSLVFDRYLELLNTFKKKDNLEFNELLFNANPYRILSGGLSARGLEIVFEELRKKLMITLTPKSLRQACIFKWLGQDKADNLIKEWLGLAPSYSLKLYKEHMSSHIYHDTFLEELYKNNLSKTN